MFNVSSSLVYVRLHTLMKVMNSPCHWLLNKIVPIFCGVLRRCPITYHSTSLS